MWIWPEHNFAAVILVLEIFDKNFIFMTNSKTKAEAGFRQ